MGLIRHFTADAIGFWRTGPQAALPETRPIGGTGNAGGKAQKTSHNHQLFQPVDPPFVHDFPAPFPTMMIVTIPLFIHGFPQSLCHFTGKLAYYVI
ncbi:hypothetical protein [Trichloromonas acetexigens]|jgi:hypothetical protein|uniref:hypothetical protein n=1 Tax=Trichloromonas acetexigens TaxID=38815 RepID=UPI0014782338|nr:hypothetical protein [Desulfuromonas acetexigens]